MTDGSSATTPEQVRTLIRDKLDRAAMTQGDLALRLGIDRTTVNRYLNGQMILTVSILLRIAAAVGCDPRDLVGTDEAVA